MPLENHQSFGGLAQSFDALPGKIGEMLDERATRGALTLDQIVRAAEQAPQLTGISKDVALIKQMTSGHERQEHADARVETRRGMGPTARFMCEFRHRDGDYRRVPRTWVFPTLGLQPLYVYWHTGDEEKNFRPMKFLERRDVVHIDKRAPPALSKIRRVMTLIDDRVKSKGMRIKPVMTPAEANSLYAHGEEAIIEIVSPKTKTGRTRTVSRVKYRTVVEYMCKKKGQIK